MGMLVFIILHWNTGTFSDSNGVLVQGATQFKLTNLEHVLCHKSFIQILMIGTLQSGKFVHSTWPKSGLLWSSGRQHLVAAIGVQIETVQEVTTSPELSYARFNSHLAFKSFAETWELWIVKGSVFTKFTTGEALQFVLNDDVIRHKTHQLWGNLEYTPTKKSANLISNDSIGFCVECHQHSSQTPIPILGSFLWPETQHVAVVATPQNYQLCEVWELQSGTKQFGVRCYPAQIGLWPGTIRHKTVLDKVTSGTKWVWMGWHPAQNRFGWDDIRHKMGLDGMISGTKWVWMGWYPAQNGFWWDDIRHKMGLDGFQQLSPNLKLPLKSSSQDYVQWFFNYPTTQSLTATSRNWDTRCWACACQGAAAIDLQASMGRRGRVSGENSNKALKAGEPKLPSIPADSAKLGHMKSFNEWMTFSWNYFELFHNAWEFNCFVARWPSINIVSSRPTKGWSDHSSWDIRCICGQETGEQGQLLILVERLSPGKHGGCRRSVSSSTRWSMKPFHRMPASLALIHEENQYHQTEHYWIFQQQSSFQRSIVGWGSLDKPDLISWYIIWMPWKSLGPMQLRDRLKPQGPMFCGHGCFHTGQITVCAELQMLSTGCNLD